MKLIVIEEKDIEIVYRFVVNVREQMLVHVEVPKKTVTGKKK